jgi:hypothetical protein
MSSVNQSFFFISYLDVDSRGAIEGTNETPKGIKDSLKISQIGLEMGSKWVCKVGTCSITNAAKWLFTQHLKKMHGLEVKKTKFGCLLIH